MAQQNINFGSFPDDPDADAIRSAFAKVQNNFNEVYDGIAGTAVSSIIAGAGIQVSAPTGNVVISANIACVRLQTSTLTMGIGGNGATDAVITSSSNICVIDLPANISNISNITLSGYLSATGNVTGGNLNTGGLVTATGNITGGNVVTGGLVTATGNITGGNLVTGGLLTVTGNANIGNIGTVGLITATGNITGGNLITGGLVTATGNITGANLVTGGVLSVTGNANIGNIGTGGLITATGNITGGNLVTSGVLSVTGNANIGNVGATLFVGNLSGTGNSNVGNLGATGIYATTLSSTGDSNVGNLGTGGLITATGNISTSAFLNSANLSVSGNATIANLSVTGTLQAGDIGVSSIQNGTSNVDIVGTSGNVTTSVNGNANIVVVTDTGANVNGYLSVSGNANVGNVGATLFVGNLSGSGNSNVGNIGATTFVGNLSGTGNSNVGNLGFGTGTITGTGTISTGNITVTGTANLGDLSNIKILGSTGVNVYLQGDSSGNLSWVGLVATPPGGINTSVQFNDNSTYNGSSGFTFNKLTNDVYMGGALSIVGNATVGNLSGTLLTGTLTTAAQPNITSVGNLSALRIDGATIANGNINTGRMAVVAGSWTTDVQALSVTQTWNNASIAFTGIKENITDTASDTNSLLVDLQVGGTSKFNVTKAGNVSATGNVTGSYFLGNGSQLTGLPSGTSITNGTSNVVVASSGNVTTSVAGNADIIVATGTGANVNGYLSVSGNANVGNIGATGFYGAATGLTSVPAGNLTGTIPSGVLGNSSLYVGTTSIALNRGSASQSLTGVNIDGSAGSATTAGTVTTAAQPNITSVGTLTSLSSSGNITGANLITTGYHIRSVGTSISAAGTTQGTATALTKEMNIVSTVASGANGVVLPTAVAGMVLTITNTTANTLNVFPASGAAINSLAANASFSQGTTTIQFIAPTATQWYTTGATYA